MDETGDHRQWGYYDWDEVYAVRRRVKEQEGKTKHEDEGTDRVISSQACDDCSLFKDKANDGTHS